MARKTMTLLASSITLLLLAAAPSRLHAQVARAPMTFVIVIDISGSMDDKFAVPLQPVLTDSTKLMDVKRRLAALCDNLPAKTRVLVTVFDHQATRLCDVMLESPPNRERLRQVFSSIKTRNGSTYLWRTADAELARAAIIAKENPEGRVRVLLYTDGEDMEKAAGFDHHTIVRKYGPTLQSSVTLDWISIGFDLQSEIRRELEMHGVKFTKADKPEDIVPLRAGFRLSGNRVQVRDAVQLFDDSLGEDITERIIDWGDGSPYQHGVTEGHQYKNAGSFRVRYLVKTAQGKSHQTSGQITVTAPPPPSAAFRFVEAKVKPGDVLHLINESNAAASSFAWSVNGKKFSTDRHPSLTIDRYGDYSISLTVSDRLEQSSSVVHTLAVPRPAAPVADFELPDMAEPDREIVLVDKSRGESNGDGEWFLDDRLLGTGAVCKFKTVAARTHVVRRVIHGPGGESQAERILRVKGHSLPRPGFTIGNVHPFVGDVIRITDISTGIVDRSIFKISDREEPITIVAPSSGQRWFELACQRAGEITIRQTVVGPGGAAESVDTVLVASRAIPPKCDFEIERTMGKETLVVRFVNRSTGTIVRFEFEPGDGSPVQATVEANFAHTYPPGRWVPSIKAYGPDGEPFAPSTWTGLIEVPKPTPAWVRSLSWQIPVGLLSAALIAYGLANWRSRRIQQRQLCLSGTLRVRPASRPRDAKLFNFEGAQDEAVIELDAVNKLSIKSSLEDGIVRYQVGLSRQGVAARSIVLDEDCEAKLGEYVVSYSA